MQNVHTSLFRFNKNQNDYVGVLRLQLTECKPTVRRNRVDKY